MGAESWAGIGSTIASLFFLYNMVQDHIPIQVSDYVATVFHKVFSFFKPYVDITIQEYHGEGEYFKRDVTLDIKASPGIVVEPTQALVKASDRTSVHLRITAARDAALGEYKVYVTGTPTTGEPAKTEFTVKVVSP